MPANHAARAAARRLNRRLDPWIPSTSPRRQHTAPAAYDWTAAQRQAYANDLDESLHLVAVTARSNRQKADQDVATWQPPFQPARCRYAAEWTAIKLRWQLSVDAAEEQALRALADDCPDQRLPEVGDQV
ncbi:hypothetical protein [Nonomuraea sp. NPDC001023]|uniref:hypothetical protein n=1 Tax=unclassified Nonomuraea TaxID=2593643 RepID=UPI00331A1D3F